MYIIVRGDLPIGLQMAQICHVSVEFAIQRPEEAKSTPIGVVLTVSDEQSLIEIASELDGVLFREPDIGDQATAFACVGDGRTLSHLPLAGRELAMA